MYIPLLLLLIFAEFFKFFTLSNFYMQCAYKGLQAFPTQNLISPSFVPVCIQGHWRDATAPCGADVGFCLFIIPGSKREVIYRCTPAISHWEWKPFPGGSKAVNSGRGSTWAMRREMDIVQQSYVLFKKARMHVCRLSVCLPP